MMKPTIICITPVKNEAWIIERFLKCTSTWADHILILDQQSDDGTREIAEKFKKVTLIDNPSASFNEPERQKVLIEAARRFPGPRLLIALDADEFFTGNLFKSPEWKSILSAPLGCVIKFQWAIIICDVTKYWIFPHELVFGFMDDGSEHVGKTIHSPRLPLPANAPVLRMNDIKVMHYWGVDPVRIQSKSRWYQCWELLNNRRENMIDYYRFYHLYDHIPQDRIIPIPQDWIEGYYQRDIDMTSVFMEPAYRWDKEVLDLFVEHGPEEFKKLAIWDVDWKKIYKKFYPDKSPDKICDPRSRLDKKIHDWLKKNQPYHGAFAKPQPTGSKVEAFVVNKMLRLIRW
jgi:glycosyltransferase involved in cell wall biosynthesis